MYGYLTTVLLASTAFAASPTRHDHALDAKEPAPAPRHEFDPKSPNPARPTPDAPASEFAAPCLPDGRPDLSQVHFAPAADGLWALGETYKARFSAAGFAYVPFLGSAAPRSFPLELSLISATCADASLDLNLAAAPRLSDASVAFERGALTERYDLSRTSVEQVFVVHQLPRRGELRLSAAWRGEYQPQAQDSGLLFAGEHGEVRVGGVHVFDAAGRALDLPLGLREGALDIVVPADFVASATLPITIDPVFTTFSFDASPVDYCVPDSAYDLGSNSWRMVCHRIFSATDTDLWTVARDSNGALIAGSSAWIDIGPERWSGARIANNRLHGKHLVVAEVGLVGSRVIKGRIVDPTSPTVGASFTIDGGELGDKHSPTVGGDPAAIGPTYFCVAWQRDLPSQDYDIHARLATAAGAPHGSTIMIDNTGATTDERPAISASNGKPPYATQQWMIVWQRNLHNGNYDVRAARIRWDGVLTQPAFTTYATPQAETYPSVSGPLDDTGGQRRYMIAYQVLESFNNFDVEVRVMEGAARVGQMNLSVVQNTAFSNQVAPSVTTDGYQFAIAYCEDVEGNWGAYDVYVDHVALHTLTSQLTQLVTHEPLSVDPALETSPRIASAHAGGAVGSRSMVSWDILRPGHRDVLGALVDGSKGVPVERFCTGSPERCPCGNFGNYLNGCANSANPNGASLSRSSGWANLTSDDLRFLVWGAPATSPMLIFAGTNVNAPLGTPFGDGLRCVLGPVKRTRVMQAVGGGAYYPEVGDVPLSALTPGLSGGDVVYYQAWYRDPAPLCGNGGYNLTSGVKVTWLP